MRAIRSGELADRAFARLVETVPARERPWLHELVYGTLRLRGRLDHSLAPLVKRGLSSLDDDVLDILRLAAYQLLEMDSVPSYAAVSQAVDMTRAARKKSAAGLVNGVLQNLTRSLGRAPVLHDDALERLSTWGSHPRWLVERWLRNYGEAATEAIVASNNMRPQTFMRRLDEDEFRAVEGSVADALAASPAIVQDPAAGLVARYVAARAGVVADLCAAPGGKTIAMANDVGERGFVIASDISPSRLVRVVENAQRTGMRNIRYAVADARSPAVTSADVVLIDAPCTGTGTFRRHPDGKWRVQQEDLQALVKLQSEILDAASGVVNVGGILVYSTCSIEPEENQEQVSAFLERHPNFLRRPPADWHDPASIDEVGNLVLLPQQSGYDGAFAARLERVA